MLTILVAALWTVLIGQPIASSVRAQLPTLWRHHRVRIAGGRELSGDKYIELVRLERAADAIVAEAKPL